MTVTEPAGDKGANDFKLDSKNKNLHAYWDSMIDKAIPRRSNEGTSAYLNRVAAAVSAKHPKDAVADHLKPGKFEDWARESLEATKAHVYPTSLKRNLFEREILTRTRASARACGLSSPVAERHDSLIGAALQDSLDPQA